MKIQIPYDFKNWNDYINIERRNKFLANKIKQEEKNIIRMICIGKRYSGKYPVELVITTHFKDHRKDLDNVRIKGVLDGLVSSGVLKNDNLNCINKITLIPCIDGQELMEIEIKENI